MKSRWGVHSQRQITARNGLLCLCVFLLWLCTTPVHAAGLRLVVNDGVAEGTLDRKALRALYTLRKRNWPDGKTVTLFVLPDSHPVHQRFAKERLRLYPYQLRQRWDRAVFSGTGIAPNEVADEVALLNAVSKTPGAMGYTEAERLPPGVRAVEEKQR